MRRFAQLFAALRPRVARMDDGLRERVEPVDQAPNVIDVPLSRTNELLVRTLATPPLANKREI